MSTTSPLSAGTSTSPYSAGSSKQETSVISDVTTSQQSISETIKDDHKRINESYEEILKATDPKTRRQWQNQFIWELARHSVAEELVLYRQFEKKLGAHGKQMADTDRNEHQKVKEILKNFEKMEPEDPAFIPTVKDLMTDLRNHIKGEEEDDLPKLEAELTPEESASITRAFDRRKIIAPTRAHAWAGSDGGVFETVAGLFAAPIDHLADIFYREQPHAKVPNPSTK